MKSKSIVVGFVSFVMSVMQASAAEVVSPSGPYSLMNEEQKTNTSRLIKTLKDASRAEYVDGYARRSVHAKSTGCVKASFEVRSDLSPVHSMGLLKSGSIHKAIIRYSNGSGNSFGDDHSGDTRGMAVKLIDSQAKRFVDDPSNPSGNDFILLSHPKFFLNESGPTAEFFEKFDAGGIAQLAGIPFVIGLDGTKTAAEMLMQKIDNPLGADYWSVTPYQLGSGNDPRVVRYHVEPCVEGSYSKSGLKSEGKNFLREAIKQTLNSGEVCLSFQIQDRGILSQIDDINGYDNWDAKTYPFVEIAKIRIPTQHFDSAEQNLACEKLSFNPWHTTSEHAPLGIINAMRGPTYHDMYDLRSTMNSSK
jgi:hypothetical protein